MCDDDYPKCVYTFSILQSRSMFQDAFQHKLMMH